MKLINPRNNLAVILVLLINVPVWSQYSGSTWQYVKSKKSGTISIAYVNAPGFVYAGDNGELDGVCVDIMADFVSFVNTRYGTKLTAKYVGDGLSFTDMYNKVRTSKGGVVGVGNITIKESRKKEVKFSPSFITNFSVLLTPSHVPTLTSLDKISSQFDGLTAYAIKGGTNGKRILQLKNKYLPALDIKYLPSSVDIKDKLLVDKNAFAYLDLVFYLDAIKRRQKIKRHPAGDQGNEQFGFIMPMNSDWQPVITEFFNANGGYVNSVKYRTILKKHLGETGVKLLMSGK